LQRKFQTTLPDMPAQNFTRDKQVHVHPARAT
jgi:hypothetical protein